jgi:hypothetical protein
VVRNKVAVIKSCRGVRNFCVRISRRVVLLNLPPSFLCAGAHVVLNSAKPLLFHGRLYCIDFRILLLLLLLLLLLIFSILFDFFFCNATLFAICTKTFINCVQNWPLFQLLILYTVCRTPWTGDQPVAKFKDIAGCKCMSVTEI